VADDGMRRGNTRGLKPSFVWNDSTRVTLPNVALTVVGCEMKESFSFAETARGPLHPPAPPYLTTKIIKMSRE
jgi:hypothetical protein